MSIDSVLLDLLSKKSYPSIAEAKSKILTPVAQLANQIPSYPLLTVALGKDPINGASIL